LQPTLPSPRKPDAAEEKLKSGAVSAVVGGGP
jgi:hypothetical protein